MKEYKVENHVSSFLPEGKEWTLAWSDEFDGEALDQSKWNFRRYFWGKLSPTFLGEEGIYVCDGSLHMPLIKKGDDYYSVQLQTGGLTFDKPKDSKKFWPFGEYDPAKFMHKFGYYECRCKIPVNDGWHAAFWLQAPGIGSHPDARYGGVECDIMESYLKPSRNEMICGNGWGGYGKNSKWYGHFHFPYEETEDGWHTYAVDWTKEGYIFYADGKEVGRQMAPECPVSEVDEFVLLTTECHGYNRCFANTAKRVSAAGDADVWKGEPVDVLKSAVLPDEFVVDYVRVFDEINQD